MTYLVTSTALPAGGGSPSEQRAWMPFLSIPRDDNIRTTVGRSRPPPHVGLREAEHSPIADATDLKGGASMLRPPAGPSASAGFSAPAAQSERLTFGDSCCEHLHIRGSISCAQLCILACESNWTGSTGAGRIPNGVAKLKKPRRKALRFPVRCASAFLSRLPDPNSSNHSTKYLSLRSGLLVALSTEFNSGTNYAVEGGVGHDKSRE